ncbi:MAG TPA: Uma2 family endonuclease [Candidatus Angelobacter sp.]|jgi:Uma2 family endonuclease|nr:Uma2 family endonuclease [Candidatus Angelobacter sp.]
MGTVTKLTFEEYTRLQEAADENIRYELDEGELVLTPSPTPYHNIVRYRLRRALTDFIEAKGIGLVADKIDFRLSANTVRNPDIAFITKDHLHQLDVHRSPIHGSPALAVEIISPTNTAQEIAKKTHQYLRSGCQSVWIVYPTLRFVEIHSNAGVCKVEEPQPLTDETLLPGFSLSLAKLFDDPNA